MAQANRGAFMTGRFQPAFALARLFLDTLVALVRARRQPGQIVDQMYIMGNKSVLFITVTIGFLGMISIYQVAMQIQKILPDFSMVGAAFLQIMIREFGPTITGLMIATRVGSGIAAEIGSMVVTEQVDALRMCNADPVNYLIVPRFVASGVMVVCLTIYAVLIAEISGLFTGAILFGIHPLTFLSTQLTVWQDVLAGLLKAVAFGFTIPVIAAQAGLEATGGSEGVGWATTRAVVNASFAVVVLDFILSGLTFPLY